MQCNRAAPGNEQFARAHPNDLKVVGLGTQDSLAEAKDFVSRHGLTVQMLWDKSRESWRKLGVASQPAYLLLSKEGTKLKRWSGELSEADMAEVVRLAREG